MPRLVGRQHEDGLGQVELAGDRCIAARVEPFRIEHHGERVAGERPSVKTSSVTKRRGMGPPGGHLSPRERVETAIAVPVRDYSLTGSAVTPHRSLPLGEVGKSISTTTGQWSLAFGRSQPTRG